MSLLRKIFKKTTKASKEVPCHVDNTPSEKFVSLKRFSDSRNVYWTTTTKGKLVQVESPAKQFKSSLRSTKYASSPLATQCLNEYKYRSNTICVDDYDKRDQPKSKAVRKMVDKADEISAKHIKNIKLYESLCKMITGVKESDVKAYENLPLVGKLIKRGHAHIDDITEDHHICISNFISARYGSLGLLTNTNQTAFHAHQMHEWRRVRRYIVDTIEECHATALLSLSMVEYGKRGFSIRVFKKVDNRISYTILTLVHFPIFHNDDQMIEFWDQLARVGEKTKFVLSFIDRVVRLSLHQYVNAALGRRELLKRCLPRHAENWIEHLPTIEDLVLTTYASAEHLVKWGKNMKKMPQNWARSMAKVVRTKIERASFLFKRTVYRRALKDKRRHLNRDQRKKTTVRVSYYGGRILRKMKAEPSVERKTLVQEGVKDVIQKVQCLALSVAEKQAIKYTDYIGSNCLHFCPRR